jgi:hypothetical protein
MNLTPFEKIQRVVILFGIIILMLDLLYWRP